MSPDEFWSRVDKSNGQHGCWPWMFGKFSNGYGQVFWNGDRRGAHRVAFELSGGKLTDESPFVLHRCARSRDCCNPSHLYAGSDAQNKHDRDADGTTAIGVRNGARTMPQRLQRGDAHWTRRPPEPVPRGDCHYSKCKDEDQQQ